jgi:hypothetical protein
VPSTSYRTTSALIQQARWCSRVSPRFSVEHSPPLLLDIFHPLEGVIHCAAFETRKPLEETVRHQDHVAPGWFVHARNATDRDPQLFFERISRRPVSAHGNAQHP